MMLTAILLYSVLFSLTQIATYERMRKSEKLEYGKAADEVLDISAYAKNLAFRAHSAELESENGNIDPTIALWQARLVRTSLRYSVTDNDAVDIPIKYCD
mmetsp:Transcript_16230/g.20578  ORF Transcript_16230/g.20578 Transcript_16230/m.20578 type:complete len:100 (+) Transcript_16230:338-637(+)